MKKIFTILAGFLIMEASMAQNENIDIPKGNFQEMAIPQKSYNRITPVYHADASVLAREWHSTGFSLQNGQYATGVYPSNDTLSTKSKPVLLPELSGTQKLFLQLNGSFETEYMYDFLWILVSTDGGDHFISLGARYGKCDDWNETFNLTRFAGKEILLSLCLVADESFEGTGCSLDAVDIFVETADPSPSLFSSVPIDLSSQVAKLTITGIGDNNYPDYLFLYFTAIDSSGKYITGLTEEDITLTVNNKKVNDCMSLEESSNTPVDIAFLVDNSLSMERYYTKINDNIQDLIDSLASNFEARAGLYRFGYSYNINSLCPGTAEKYGGKFFWNLKEGSDLIFFKNDIWDKNVQDGFTERYYEAFHEFALMTDLNYTDNAKKVLIMLGDECVYGDNNTDCNYSTSLINVNRVIEDLQGQFTVINITATSCSDYFSPISSATGGVDIDIYEDNYSEVMGKIAEVVGANYVLRIDMRCLDLLDTLECLPIQISVTGRDSIFDNICPNPKESVVMRRTASTVALDTICVNQQDSSIRLSVYLTNVPEEVSPGSIEVTAYLSDSIDANTISTVAIYDGAGNYYVTVPASLVREPLFHYRFQAIVPGSDRLVTSPNRNNSKWTVAVCENYPPSITNVEYTCSDSLLICADITDSTLSVAKKQLYYHVIGTVASFLPVEMKPCPSCPANRYCAAIPVPAGASAGIEYYIYAEDNYGAQGWYHTSELPDTISCSIPCVEAVVSSNPITSFSDTLTFTLPEASQTTIYLLDKKGMPVYLLDNNGEPTSHVIPNVLDENLEAGTHKLSLKSLFIHKLDPRTPYILVIETGDQKSIMYLYVSRL